MKTKHTKGEWIIGVKYSEYESTIVSKDGKRIAEVKSYPNNGILNDVSKSERIANAKLIAAAPEMLKALQCISSFVYDKSVKGCTYGDTNYDSESAVYGYNMCLDNLQEIANNAIKKATE